MLDWVNEPTVASCACKMETYEMVAYKPCGLSPNVGTNAELKELLILGHEEKPYTRLNL